MIHRLMFANDWLNYQFFSVQRIYVMEGILRPRMQALLPVWICARFLFIVLFKTMVERRTLCFSIPEVRVLLMSLVQVVFIWSRVEDFINFRCNICTLLDNCPVIFFVIFLALGLLLSFILEMTRYSLFVNMLVES